MMAFRLPFRRGAVPMLVAGLWLAGPGAIVAAAQDVEERFPGVSLGLTYETRTLPTLAMQPFTGVDGGDAIAGQIEGIV